jgi:hypothetical protein
MHRMRPRQSVQEVVIEAALWPTEKVENRVEVEMMLADVLAGKKCEYMVRLAGTQNPCGGRHFVHVHECDGRRVPGTAREAVFEAYGRVPDTIGSEIFCEWIVGRAQFEACGQSELEQAIHVSMQGSGIDTPLGLQDSKLHGLRRSRDRRTIGHGNKLFLRGNRSACE